MIFHDSKGRPCVQYVTRLSCSGGTSRSPKGGRVGCHWRMTMSLWVFKVGKGKDNKIHGFPYSFDYCLYHMMISISMIYIICLYMYIYTETYMRYIVIYSYRYTYVCESTKGMSCHVTFPSHFSTRFEHIILGFPSCCNMLFGRQDLQWNPTFQMCAKTPLCRVAFSGLWLWV